MFLEFFGASNGVTGSCHRIHVNGADLALDCGLYQGHRSDALRLNREVPRWLLGAEAVVLSHAHIDHSGNLPTLAARGFRGHIFATPATRDLSSVMLRDSAMVQAQDAAYLNRKNAKNGSAERIDPLYTVEDAEAAVGQMISLPLHRSLAIAPGAKLTFHDSGHVLGSSLVQLDLEEKGKKLRLLFTGDLGRAELPLLRNPEIVEGVDLLLIESTYGDRLHPDLAETDARLAAIIEETIGRGGRVYIPTFALERAQEVLYSLERFSERGKLPDVPIYIDSPLAIAITEIYKLHPESLDPEVRQRILDKNDPFSPPNLRYVSDIGASKAIQASKEPCIIIAGSGMCEAGRIVHHFTRALSEPKNSVVIVGFQADHTLGRRLIEGHRKVKVFGLERDVWCKVHSLGGLSAHADRDDLVAFAQATAKLGNLRRIGLVHGEDAPKAALAARMQEVGLPKPIISEKGLRIDL